MSVRTRNRSVTIEETAQAMAELAMGEDPSLLHALRSASLCLRMKLMCSTGYAIALQPWRDSPLPEREELLAVLDQAIRQDGSGEPAYGRMESHLNALYSIDEFWFSSGLRDVAYQYGATLEEQRQWRCQMNRIICGMGYKTLSWALFIYDPANCQLLTLDSWHARRLAVAVTTIHANTPSAHARYERLECQLIDEVSQLYPGHLSTVGAACLWYNLRNRGPESHLGLSCRRIYA